MADDPSKNLLLALAACRLKYGVSAESTAELRERLAAPPLSVRSDGLRKLGFIDAGADLLEAAALVPKDAIAAMWGWMYGRPGLKWGELRRAEKQAARRLIAYLNGPSVYRQERPRDLDPALVLWIAFTLEEALGLKRLPFRRPPDGGAPFGPAFHALMAALGLEHAMRMSLANGMNARGAVVEEPWSPKNDAVADILQTSRKPAFADILREHGLKRSAEAVAERPAHFRLAIAEARKAHRRAKALRARTSHN